MATEPIEDPISLPGETVNDQVGNRIGKIKSLYAVGEDEAPMWVVVEGSIGIAGKRDLFIPLARLKLENDELRVPYSANHVHESPEIEAEEELSERDELALRNFYAIDLGDNEIRTDNDSYAAQVPDGQGAARRVG